jgi:hypothetical protein
MIDNIKLIIKAWDDEVIRVLEMHKNQQMSDAQFEIHLAIASHSARDALKKLLGE